MVGDDRKAIRAVFNRLMRTPHLNFPKKDMDIRYHKPVDEANVKEAITLTLQITNPQSQEAVDLIDLLGGGVHNTEAQQVFTLSISQGKADKDDPGQQELPGTETPETPVEE